MKGESVQPPAPESVHKLDRMVRGLRRSMAVGPPYRGAEPYRAIPEALVDEVASILERAAEDIMEQRP